jgi:hypothetical protein
VRLQRAVLCLVLFLTLGDVVLNEKRRIQRGKPLAIALCVAILKGLSGSVLVGLSRSL